MNSIRTIRARSSRFSLEALCYIAIDDGIWQFSTPGIREMPSIEMCKHHGMPLIDPHEQRAGSLRIETVFEKHKFSMTKTHQMRDRHR